METALIWRLPQQFLPQVPVKLRPRQLVRLELSAPCVAEAPDWTVRALYLSAHTRIVHCYMDISNIAMTHVVLSSQYETTWSSCLVLCGPHFYARLTCLLCY
eukprot:3826622-Pleurochrysis_carterae.AAC.1